MKRGFTLILLILYSVVSTGATFHMHYCRGELIDVDLWHSDVKKCGKCECAPGTACSKECCRDVHKTVKLEKDQQLAESVVQSMQVAVFTPVSFMEMPQVHTIYQMEAFPVSHAPPRSGKVPTHMLNCTYLI